MSRLIDILHISLVVSAIYMASVVVRKYAPKISRFSNWSTFSHTEWLQTGIVIGFLAVAIGNALYWEGYFFLELMGWESAKVSYYKSSPYFNVLTRALPYVFAAFCHLMGLWVVLKNGWHPARHLIVSLLIGLAVAILLLIFAP